MWLNPAADSLPAARGWLAAQLAGLVAERVRKDAVLVMAELVANSVEHTVSESVRVAFSLEPRGLVIEVRDQGDGLPNAWPVPGYRGRSRGLMMVSKVTLTLTSRIEPDGHAIVTAVLPV